MPNRDFDTLIDVRFSSKDVVATLDARSVVGDWQIESFVAKGGFASVFRGRSRSTGQLGAIKVLRPELVESSIAILRFRREAEMLARVRHPAIVGVYDIGEIISDVPYIVMEWIDGHTLSEEYRKRGSFTPDEVLGVLEPLCGALAAAHELGIVHRDLKPSNIMVIPDGDWFQLKLVDFGIAKMIEPLTEAAYTSLTATGTFLGTPSYMAPEQFIGLRVDARADIYALGIITYLLLTGVHPFRADNPVEMAEMHRDAKPPPVSLLSRLSPALDSVVERALAKDPSARYDNALAFFEDVRKVLQNAPQLAPTTAPAPTPHHWVGIHLMAAPKTLDLELDDDLLAEIDAALAFAEETFTESGLHNIPDGAQAILAVRKIDPNDTDQVLQAALSVRDQLDKSFEHLKWAVTVHAAPSAEQLSALRWAANSPWDAVSATQEALAHVADRIETREIDGTTGKRQVLELRSTHEDH